AVAVLADPVFNFDDPRVLSSVRGRAVQQGGSRRNLSAQAASSRQPSDSRSALMGAMRGDLTKLARLPFSREEADAIFALVPDATGLEALAFRANRTTATSSDLSQYRIVHFATHGLLNSERPELSGLVFSMVDEAGHQQDGFLRLHEIYNLRL